MSDERKMPNLNAIDDPHGIPIMVFDELAAPSEATTEFVDRVQSIRWDLWNLLGSLDNVVQPSGATQWAVMAALDKLGIAARAEAALLDGLDADPADLFTDARVRRGRHEQESEREVHERRSRIQPVDEAD